MAYTTVYQGIVFVEGTHNSAQLGKNVETDLSFCINEQLKSLRNVKDISMHITNRVQMAFQHMEDA